MNEAKPVNIASVTPLKQPSVCLKQTTCPYCGVGCGVDVDIESDGQNSKAVSLRGTSEHPANFGRLCVIGSHLLDTITPSNRLLFPEVNGLRVSWAAATDTIAQRLRDVLTNHGPDAIAFYVSGQLLTEDYYVANKLMKGFIGSANIDTNSRLCMSSAVAAYKRAFGGDLVPCCYDDLECTDLLVLTGSNAAWTHPVLFQRIERAKKANPDMKVVVLDPRETASCAIADLHLPIKPGSDAALFNGLLAYLNQQDALDSDFVEDHTNGFDAALSEAKAWDIKKVSAYCDINEVDLKRLYDWYIECPSAITFFSMGINQSNTGTDKGNAIINAHLAMGKIGKPGSGPFSITGQPNAMGGREVGGLANLLAAHMDFANPDDIERVKSFWNAPSMAQRPGLKAVDLFDQMAMGKIKFIWVMATNPVVSMPNREQVEAALQRCDTVVVSDCVSQNDTLAFADIKLPAAGWSEKDGTVTNSERRISRQRGILPCSGEAKPDWLAMCEVAQKLGFESAFDYHSPREIFLEHARLSGVDNDGSRGFDISGLSQLSTREYDQLRPIQWPVNASHIDGKKRLFSDGRFYTPNGKANFIAISPKAPAQQVSDAFPYVLNSGRMRDQWHTMTRTGLAPALLKHTDQAYLHISKQDMHELGVNENELVAIRTKFNKNDAVILPVKETTGLRAKEVFAPIHWSKSWGSHIALGQSFSGAHDGVSGQPELKHGAVSITPVKPALQGYLVVKQPLDKSLIPASFGVWSLVQSSSYVAYRFASDHTLAECRADVSGLLAGLGEQLALDSDVASRKIVCHNGQLTGAVWMATSLPSINTEWIENVFASEQVTHQTMSELLNLTPDDDFLKGPVICSCFNVRKNTIVNAITEGCESVEALGHQLKCGTNCGSCRSELAQVLAQSAVLSESE